MRRLSSPPQHEGEGLSSQPPGATSDGPTCSSGSTSSQDPDPWVAPKSTFIRSKGRHHSNHTAIPENFSLIVHFPNYVFAEKQKTEHSPGPGVPAGPGRRGRCRGRGRGPTRGHTNTRVSGVSHGDGPKAASAVPTHRRDTITPCPAPPKRRQKHPTFTRPLLKNKHSKKYCHDIYRHAHYGRLSLCFGE